MNNAITFPGQGSQLIGMGQDFFENFSLFKELIEEASDAVKLDIKKIALNGPEDKLNATENTQPILMAISVAMFKTYIQQHNIKISDFAKYAAGHSLGEYSALVATNALNIGDCAKILQIRGKAMQDACPIGVGAMAAILGGDIEQVKQIVEDANSNDFYCAIANDNSSGQQVISGHTQAIDKAIDLAKDQKLKAIKLKVSAPFHSKLMQPAADIMREALNIIAWREPEIEIVSNVTVEPTKDIETIKSNLVQQVAGQVRWRETIEFFANNNISKLYEFGPGKVLSGLAKKTNRELNCLNINSITDLDHN